ncbi:MAG: HlyD family secretion protein, partial [Anaerotignaceae bacterium]
DLSRTIEREYLAENSSITVGVDAVGQIELIGKQLSMQNGLTVKDLLVEVGDEVKTGDTLLTLDKDQIDKTLKELQIKRNTAASVLKTAIDNKNLTQSLSNSKIDDVKHQSQQAYDNSITAIKQNIDSLNLQIAQTTEQIQNLEAQITNISELEIENNNQDLHEQINVLREQLATLQSSLASANAECVALENNRNDEIARENASVSLMQKENDIQLVSLQTAIDTAQADVNKIDEEILATTKLLEVQSLIATVDGVVLSISVQAGQTIGVELGALNNSYEQGGSSVVIVIGEKSQQQFTVLVESSEINNIEVGQQVEFECVAFPGQKFTGKISNRKLVPNDGKYEVTVMVD